MYNVHGSDDFGRLLGHIIAYRHDKRLRKIRSKYMPQERRLTLQLKSFEGQDDYYSRVEEYTKARGRLLREEAVEIARANKKTDLETFVTLMAMIIGFIGIFIYVGI